MDGQWTVNLSVKNRLGTLGSRILNKRVFLFCNDDDPPDEPFGTSGLNEINVLAITGYHGGWISETQELDLVREYLDGRLAARNRPVIDAVIVRVRGAAGITHYKIPSQIAWMKPYFPQSRDVREKEIVVRHLLNDVDLEDDSHIGVLRWPTSLRQAIELHEPARVVRPW